MEDDPIVGEIPLTLVTSLVDQLHLLSFAHKSSDEMYKHLLFEPKIKPQNNKFNSGLWLDNNHEDYDPSVGQELAPENMHSLPSIDYESAGKENTVSFISVNNKDSVCLLPYSTFHSMEPKYEHIDAKKLRDNKSNPKETDESENASVPINMKLSSVAQQGRREENLARQKLEAEPWVKLKTEYEDPSCSTVKICPLNELIPEKTDTNVPPFDLTWDHYFLKSVFVKPPLIKDLLTVFKRSYIVPHKDLLLICSHDSESEILASLEKISILIQGVWVIDSENCFPNDYKPATYKLVIDTKIVRQIWNFMLCLFQDGQTIDQHEFVKTLKNVNGNALEVITDLLRNIAEIKNKRWSFKYQDNKDLQNVSIIKRQRRILQFKAEEVKDSGFFTKEATDKLPIFFKK